MEKCRIIAEIKPFFMAKKPFLGFWQICNLSFGFFGVQIAYSLQKRMILTR
jgi:hypothetical protein